MQTVATINSFCVQLLNTTFYFGNVWCVFKSAFKIEIMSVLKILNQTKLTVFLCSIDSRAITSRTIAKRSVQHTAKDDLSKKYCGVYIIRIIL